MRLGGRLMDDLLHGGEHCFTDSSIERHVTWFPYCEVLNKKVEEPARDGSIIIIVATDAPLLPHQLMRLAKRPSLGLGRLGAISSDGSGDIFMAFSTANPGAISENEPSGLTMFPNNGLRTVFQAAVWATEEAVVNAMVAAETVIGAAGLKIEAIPHDRLREIFAQPNRNNRQRPATD